MAQINLSTKQKQTHRHKDQICGCHGSGGGGEGWTGNLRVGDETITFRMCKQGPTV